MHWFAFCDSRYTYQDRPGIMGPFNKVRMPVKASYGLFVMLVQGDDNLMRFPGDKIDFKWYMAQFGFKADAIYRDSIF
jgi:hypothetical protein